jgi:hypothetical protein
MPHPHHERTSHATRRLIASLLLGLVVCAGCGGRQAVRPPADAAPAATPPAATPAAAPAPTTPPPVELPLTADTVAAMLAVGDQSAVRLDAGSVVLRRGALQVLVFLEDDGHTLQAVLPYLGLHAGDPRLIERWNATRRFGRAYLDHEEGPTLAGDLLLATGAPAALVHSWGRLFLDMADAFRAEVWPTGRPPVHPHDE